MWMNYFMDPDQLALSEASCSGSSIYRYMISKDIGSICMSIIKIVTPDVIFDTLRNCS